MKNRIALSIAIFMVAQMFLVRTEAQNVSEKPSKLQLSQSERGYGMFIHFGLNTFNETEWSDGTLPVSSFNPTNLDCDQWVKVAKEAGFRYVILITKHHDGFCLWDSKFTDYDVASAPVKRDIVAEVSKACKKYGIEFGLYYSLWDRHEPSHNSPDPQAYVDYMKSQLTELLTNYGNVCELWFDGGWAKKDTAWHIAEVYSHIKKLQPDCLLTVNHTIAIPGKKSSIRQPKDMQPGDPIRFYPVDFRTKDPNIARWDDPKLYEYKGKLHYLIFEHTLCISDRWNWFQKNACLPVRSTDELEELFYWCTANDNILIINVPPDQTGQLRQHEVNRILEVADRLGIRGGKSKLPSAPEELSFGKIISATSCQKNSEASSANDFSLETAWMSESDTASLTIDFKTRTAFDRISLLEYFEEKELGDGFSILHKFAVEEFSIETFDGSKWATVYMGEEIGACKLINLPLMNYAQKIRFNIRKANKPAGLFHVGVSNSHTKGIRMVKNE